MPGDRKVAMRVKQFLGSWRLSFDLAYHAGEEQDGWKKLSLETGKSMMQP
jgi:hypothetical protein